MNYHELRPTLTASIISIMYRPPRHDTAFIQHVEHRILQQKRSRANSLLFFKHAKKDNVCEFQNCLFQCCSTCSVILNQIFVVVASKSPLANENARLHFNTAEQFYDPLYCSSWQNLQFTKIYFNFF